MLNKKFTLIELLVVVAIIGILVSILMPSLTNARKQAMLAVCKSNLKQSGTTLVILAKDNNSKYIRDTNKVTHNRINHILDGFVEKGGTSAFFCPFSPIPGGKKPEDSNAANKYTSYGIWGGLYLDAKRSGPVYLHDANFTWDNNTEDEFNILAADWERTWGQKLYTSHPDSAGAMPFKFWDNSSWFGAYFRNPNKVRGLIERNFLHTDLSVSMLKKLRLDDTRLERLFRDGSTIWYLPKKN